jgi:magnesium transporter
MITIHESYSKGPGETGGYTWVDARDVNRDDITLLQEKYNIDSDLLADIMDQDEQSRIEKEDTYVDLILRLPALSESEDTLDQQALPLGIVMFPEMIITICQGDSVVLDDFAKKRYRHYPVSTMEGFVISLMGRATMVYIRVLKYLNRRKDQVEGQLHKSIMNYELLQLLQIQKSLVYLTTSLTTNEALLERLNNKGTFFHLDGPDEQDFLEDTITDNKQAIQMANIYTDILTGNDGLFRQRHQQQHEHHHEAVDHRVDQLHAAYVHHQLLRHERQVAVYRLSVGVAVHAGRLWHLRRRRPCTSSVTGEACGC